MVWIPPPDLFPDWYDAAVENWDRERDDRVDDPRTRLKRRRELAGMSQADVADSAGVSQTAYCRYERREAEPEVNDAHRIAKVLGIRGVGRIAASFGKENAALKPAATKRRGRLARGGYHVI